MEATPSAWPRPQRKPTRQARRFWMERGVMAARWSGPDKACKAPAARPASTEANNIYRPKKLAVPRLLQTRPRINEPGCSNAHSGALGRLSKLAKNL